MQQKKPVPHKEAPAGDLYAMPDKKKDVSHTSGPVTGDEYALASKPKVRKYLIFVCVLCSLCIMYMYRVSYYIFICDLHIIV